MLSNRICASSCRAAGPCRHSHTAWRRSCCAPHRPARAAPSGVRRKHSYQRNPISGVCAATGPDGGPYSPQLSPAAGDLWAPIVAQLVAGQAADVNEDALEDLLFQERADPQDLIWHGLPLVRPFFMDVGGMQDPSIVRSFVNERMDRFDDFSPLVWALGLQQPVESPTSSPLPPPLHPPLPTEFRIYLLNDQIEYLEVGCSATGFNFYLSATCGEYLAILRCILVQLQQQQPEVLEGFTCLRELWQLAALARNLPAFWQLVREVPALQRDLPGLVRYVGVKEVVPLAQGLVSLGLLPSCTAEDIWWLVARLDHVTGDRTKVLQVFEQLALQAPDHGALEHLGTLLLHYATEEVLYWQAPGDHNASQRPVAGTMSQLDGQMRGKVVAVEGPMAGLAVFAHLGHPDANFHMGGQQQNVEKLEPSFAPNRVAAEVIPRLTCHMSGSEVVAWSEQLQAVWAPAHSHRLLLQLLVTPLGKGMFSAAARLKLYDLLLLQLARSGWPPQQQVMGGTEQQQQQLDVRLPPAAADVVLGLLPDAATSNAAAVQVLVVWRHVCGTLQPHWFHSESLHISDSTLEGVGVYIYWEIRRAQETMAAAGKGKKPPMWQNRQQRRMKLKEQPDEYEMDLLYDSAGMLSPADVDATGSVTAVGKVYATLGQHHFYSRLGLQGRRQVAAAVARLGLPVKLGHGPG